MNDQKILRLCQEIEMLCYEIYILFADQFADDPAVSALWQKTAAEELNHARQFDVALRLGKALTFTSTLSLAAAEQTKEKLLSNLRQCRLSRPSLKGALEGAIVMEKGLSRFHMDCAVSLEDVTMRKMFESMMLADNQHLEALQQAYARYAANS